MSPLSVSLTSSRLHCLCFSVYISKSTKVRSHGNSVRDVIIAHVISVDAQINRCRNGKVNLGQASCALCGRLVKIPYLCKATHTCPLTLPCFNFVPLVWFICWSPAVTSNWLCFILSHGTLLTYTYMHIISLSSYLSVLFLQQRHTWTETQGWWDIGFPGYHSPEMRPSEWKILKILC